MADLDILGGGAHRGVVLTLDAQVVSNFTAVGLGRRVEPRSEELGALVGEIFWTGLLLGRRIGMRGTVTF